MPDGLVWGCTVSASVPVRQRSIYVTVVSIQRQCTRLFTNRNFAYQDGNFPEKSTALFVFSIAEIASSSCHEPAWHGSQIYGLLTSTKARTVPVSKTLISRLSSLIDMPFVGDAKVQGFDAHKVIWKPTCWNVSKQLDSPIISASYASSYNEMSGFPDYGCKGKSIFHSHSRSVEGGGNYKQSRFYWADNNFSTYQEFRSFKLTPKDNI
ncbi:hypothetical protein BJ138DRAFT_794305 [Hygrophoropsis aurantiaca]|uniref:Uncharacterized protein n=1 Tax=Hygrophoropsis aurantiaca TaxID=72124 RepID=A0ACB8AGP2_9AGAM|nr:hypothetical protein BJ138DRAFT_794305 [Hygrophoropsis aurantiaca]